MVCGYIEKDDHIRSIILGQYRNGELVYKGHVTLGVSSEDFQYMASVKRLDDSPFRKTPAGNDAAIWIFPDLVCTVKYMMLTSTGSMRQPVFKGLRFDKKPEDCTVS